TLALAAAAVLALVSMQAPSARAAGYRVFVGPNVYRTAVVRPLPLLRPRIVYQTSAVPVFVGGTSNFVAQPVVLIPQQTNWGYVPTAVSYGWGGTGAFVGWGARAYARD